MSSPLIIFDLDGTLVDTATDLVTSLNHALVSANLNPVVYSDLKHLVGQGGKVMIKRAFDLQKAALEAEQHEELYQLFLRHYLEDMPGKSQAYCNVEACLSSLSSAGFKLAVCTNKTKALALPLLDKLGLSHYFSAITCGDSFEWRKPDGRHIHSTIDLAQSEVEQAIMVGDSINDIAAAKNAGIPSIGVTFGYTDVPMAELEPTVIVNDFSEITPLLVAELLSGKL